MASRPGTEETSVGAAATKLAGAVKERAEGMASTASEMAGQVKNKAQELGARAVETAEEAWETTREGAQQLASKVASQADDFFEDTTALIRRYPLASLCCAFCLGFLVAKGVGAMMSNTRNRS
jgi:hypothetical protein